MTVTKWNIRAGAYYDSVVLMQLQRGLLELSGVVDAGVVMATQANRDLLSANNLLPDSISANPDDLLIVTKVNGSLLQANVMLGVPSKIMFKLSVNEPPVRVKLPVMVIPVPE